MWLCVEIFPVFNKKINQEIVFENLNFLLQFWNLKYSMCGSALRSDIETRHLIAKVGCLVWLSSNELLKVNNGER